MEPRVPHDVRVRPPRIPLLLDTDLPDVALSVELDEPTQVPGQPFVGRVRVRNTSSTTRIRFDVGNAIGSTLHLDGTPAGGFRGAIAGVERRIDLAPREESTLRFIAGSEPADEPPGTALPAGRYRLVVRLRIYVEGCAYLLTTTPVDLLLTS
jgi:hypothetical protein